METDKYLTNDFLIYLINCDELGMHNIEITNFELLHDILKNEDYWCSGISKLVIYYKKDNDVKVKSFFIKTPSKSRFYEKHQLLGLFKKEAFIYKFILPKFEEILPTEAFAPRIYFINEDYTLILEELSQHGFRMYDRNEQLDLQHCYESLKLLAKFHAVSVKMAENMDNLITDVGTELVYTSSNIFSDANRYHFEKTFEVVFKNADYIYVNICSEQLARLGSEFMLKTADELNVKPNSFKVLNHGNFSMNNIMFQYDNCKRVKSVKMVDFQVCRWNSPAFDIINFVISSMKYEDFEKNFDLLLKLYTRTLNETLTILMCDQFCEFTELRQQIFSLKNFWIFSLIALILRTSTNKGVLESNPKNNFINENRYINISRKWIKFMIKKEMLPSKPSELLIMANKFFEILQANHYARLLHFTFQSNIRDNAYNNYCALMRLKLAYMCAFQKLETVVVLKCPIFGPKYLVAKKTNVYEREIFMYEKVLPGMYELWHGNNLSPKYFGATQMQSLILEDLYALGLRVVNKKLKLDFQYSMVALKTLAQFHALSTEFLRIYQQNDIEINYIWMQKNSIEIQLLNEHISTYDKFLALTRTMFKDETRRKLVDYKDKLVEELEKILMPNTTGLNVIRHGEYWSGNIMFRYNEEKKAVDSKMIDFQLSTIGTPVFDLIYFLISSVQIEVYKNYKDELLNCYLSTFNECMLLFGIYRIYTEYDLESDLEKYKFVYIYYISIQLQLYTYHGVTNCNELKKAVGEYISQISKWIKLLESEQIL